MSNEINKIEVIEAEIVTSNTNNMNTETQIVDPANLSTTELEVLLKRRKDKEAKKLVKEKAVYEKDRDEKVFNILNTAKQLL